ncbi:MAG: hypothetical protein AAF587_13440 [Bacteroidota bacterium]
MKLTFKLFPIDQITDAHSTHCWKLMEENYDHVKQETFLKDLQNKDYVGILFDEKDEIKGFTTFGVNPNSCGTQEYSILFSGDTIIHPACWGTQEMIRGGVRAAGSIMATDPEKKWYWFLISKGHRTYLYLPLFFHQYYPARDSHRHHPAYQQIVDRCASFMFREAWQADKGIIRFPQKLGQLKSSLAASTWQKKKNPNVAFFLEKNPYFHEGEELACLTELHPDNVHIRLRQELINGMQQPAYAH